MKILMINLQKYMSSFFHNKSIQIDTFPILVAPINMLFHVAFPLEKFVAGWAMIVDKRDSMDFTHVSPHVMRKSYNLPTYRAKKATITLLNIALHQVIHRKVS